MHVLGLDLPVPLHRRLVEEQIAYTEAANIDDLTNLTSLDRRNGCYQFDAVTLRVSREHDLMYPHQVYQSGIRKPIVVLFDSEQFAAMQCARWYRQGALLCMPEGSHYDMFIAALRSLVAFNQRVDTRCLIAGTVCIDTTTREVFAESEQVRLTPYEYRVFELLMRRRKRFVSSVDIFYEMCGRGEGKEPDDSIVKVYVSKLRKALKRHGIDSLEIRTHYGIGYQLVETTPELVRH